VDRRLGVASALQRAIAGEPMIVCVSTARSM
jgi:hypothetical protein